MARATVARPAWQDLPLPVILLGISAMAMLVPALHALSLRDWPVARTFLYGALLLGLLVALAALATHGHTPRRQARSHLTTLLLTFSLLPLVLAAPFQEALGNTRLLNAYVEMVSSLTTTGATFYDPDRLPPSLHLWRALVGWLGGFFMWAMGIAILAPMNLGGFEVLSQEEIGQGVSGATPITRVADASERLARFAAQLLPIYLGLTIFLAAVLSVTGVAPLDAAILALSTLSSSGITPGSGPIEAGFWGELAIFSFLLFAVSRLTFSADERGSDLRTLRQDPEIRLAIVLVCAVTLFMLLRHWVGAFDVDAVQDIGAAVGAAWGSAFMALSFLTTTGFESSAWEGARAWSGLQTPGLLLMGLALIGGGVATTAGGVKLLRLYALYIHGAREVERLTHPSSISNTGSAKRRLRRQGALVAWIFVMLFAISLAAVMLLLSFAGVAFGDAIVFAVAALSTTGPVAAVTGETGMTYGALGDAAKLILAGAMVLGRLETLAIIALLNPAFWRR